MPSTPMHVYLHQAFGWTPPSYAHVCLLVKHDKAKLSKRNFDTNLAPYQDQGVEPQALLNFVALLGWSHGSQNDKLNMEDLIQNVSLDCVSPVLFLLTLV